MTKFIRNKKGKLHLSHQDEPTWSLCSQTGDLVETDLLPVKINICSLCWQMVEEKENGDYIKLAKQMAIDAVTNVAPRHHNFKFSPWVEAVIGTIEVFIDRRYYSFQHRNHPITLNRQVFTVLAAEQWLDLVEPGGWTL